MISAEYIKSIDGTDDIIHDTKPQVVFMGRSNVGKSSLINSLVGKTLARSSKQPGKTIKLDFFLIDNKRYFVDLPGYGFAKRSKDMLEHFRKLIAWYLFTSGAPITLAVLIIDINIGLTDYDYESIELLRDHQIPFVVIANKVDKLKMGLRHKTIQNVQEACGTVLVLPYSSYTKEGRGELLKIVGFI